MLSFIWRVPVGGHVLEGRGLHAVLKPASGWRCREYRPLAEFSGLFRDFVSTPCSPEGFRAFADRFGDLWSGLAPPSGSFPREYPGEESPPMTVAHWQRELLELDCCVQAWDRIRTDQVSKEDLPELVREANSAVHGKFPPPAFVLDPGGGGLRLEPVPENLLQAMWFQFAHALNANKEHRACGQCGDWFELTPKIASKNRLYCSEACRSAAYRKRKERALELAAQGLNPQQIAEELGVDAKTVAGWLNRKTR